MKKTIFFFLSILVIFGTLANAQIVFPLTLRVLWDANLVTDNVDFYIVTVNGAASNVQPSSCTSTVCQANFTITTPGPHVVSVQAVNLFATSAATSVTFTAVAPGKSNNVKITK